eukprot:TRINITY_DN15010_c0_g1_i1.p1 TRINITY_DN15010_c0_g1~~TRINITY_DN15010_c0_g1_i1.p1  ORF type:complete len:207 (-),score=42.92 TRINITY_DN15010_c0_g1_i1:187-807(-)
MEAIIREARAAMEARAMEERVMEARAVAARAIEARAMEEKAMEAQAFNALDRNGDGVVSRAEFAAAGSARAFNALDRNGDGVISRAEFAAAAAAAKRAEYAGMADVYGHRSGSPASRRSLSPPASPNFAGAVSHQVPNLASRGPSPSSGSGRCPDIGRAAAIFQRLAAATAAADDSASRGRYPHAYDAGMLRSSNPPPPSWAFSQA